MGDQIVPFGEFIDILGKPDTGNSVPDLIESAVGTTFGVVTYPFYRFLHSTINMVSSFVPDAYHEVPGPGGNDVSIHPHRGQVSIGFDEQGNLHEADYVMATPRYMRGQREWTRVRDRIIRGAARSSEPFSDENLLYEESKMPRKMRKGKRRTTKGRKKMKSRSVKRVSFKKKTTRKGVGRRSITTQGKRNLVQSIPRPAVTQIPIVNEGKKMTFFATRPGCLGMKLRWKIANFGYAATSGVPVIANLGGTNLGCQIYLWPENDTYFTSQIATWCRFFEKYQLLEHTMYYTTNLGTATSGVLSMCFMEDPEYFAKAGVADAKTNPTDSMLNQRSNTVEFPVYSNFRYPTQRPLRKTDMYYVAGTQSTGILDYTKSSSAVRLTVQGVYGFFGATVVANAGLTAADLWFDVTIELCDMGVTVNANVSGSQSTSSVSPSSSSDGLTYFERMKEKGVFERLRRYLASNPDITEGEALHSLAYSHRRQSVDRPWLSPEGKSVEQHLIHQKKIERYNIEKMESEMLAMQEQIRLFKLEQDSTPIVLEPCTDPVAIAAQKRIDAREKEARSSSKER